MSTQTPVSVVFRYWRNGRMLQLQADVASVNAAIRTINSTGKKCEQEKLEWVGEIFPFASEPLVYGTRKGLEHQKELF